MANPLLRTKSVEQSIADTDEPEYQLKKSLTALDLTVFGVGVVIGAGIFTPVVLQMVAVGEALGHEYMAITDHSPRLKVARLAADEFGILVSDAGSVDDVLATAHELLQMVQAPIHVPGQDITLSARVGLAVMPDHATDADALLKATPPEQRTDFKPTERDKQRAPIEQIVKLEKEMSQVQTQYKDAEENYGSDLLNLVVAKGYLTKLLGNDAVKSYITRHEPEILEHFELVVNTVSMEEAVQQQLEADGEFEEPPEAEAPAQ